MKLGTVYGIHDIDDESRTYENDMNKNSTIVRHDACHVRVHHTPINAN